MNLLARLVTVNMRLMSLTVPGDDSGQTRTTDGQPNVDEGASETADQPSEDTGELPKDVIFDLLSAARRRLVLRYLAENGAEATLNDLADFVAARENGIEARLVSSKQRKRAYITLYQAHLPRLDDANVIDFDQARGTVKLRREADELFRYLEVSQSEPKATRSLGSFLSSRGLRAVRSKLRERVRPSKT